MNDARVVAMVELPGDEEREMLRESINGFLETNWPVSSAVERTAQVDSVSDIWQGMVGQGLGSLGLHPEEGGLREVAIVMSALGRAACPAPMISAALLNLAARMAPEIAREYEDVLLAASSGHVSTSFSFGAYDGDANAGHVSLRDGKVFGTLDFVEDPAGCTHYVVIADGPKLCMIESGLDAIRVDQKRGYSQPGLVQVDFDGATARSLPLTDELVADLHVISRLLLVARASGSARRAFEMATEYATERKQFGQPIGRFQAIQHKLANCLISLEGVSHTLSQATTSFDLGQPEWRSFGALCHAFASVNLRQVVLEAHHTFAAIGYAEEHELPRHFRRVHADMARLGGVRKSRREIAALLLDRNETLPAYDLGPVGNAFREEVRTWLETHWMRDGAPIDRAVPFHHRNFIDSYPEFAKELAKTGWISAGWPKEFGGQGRTPFEQLAMTEEFQRVGAPIVQAGEIQAFALMRYGTEAQRARFLPDIREGKIRFCLGYSEPGSGSDLASLKTSARREGNEWVINGQKLWTTGAEKADYMWLAARTDPDAKPVHAGISIFIVPMNAPGMTVRPSMALYGHTFCTEFLDNVRVPADALVGELNGGWKILTSALATERILMGGSVTLALAVFNDLLSHVRTSSDTDGEPLRLDGAARDRLACLASEIEVARQLLAHSVRMVEAGKVPLHEAAMSKVYTGELLQRVGETAIDIGGMGITLEEGQAGAITDGRMEQMLRRSIMMVVGGGTAEIQRSLIAQRGLGLPR